jgi:acetamidase/formamidase
MDCRELIAGSTLWLPIEVEGALFSVGDGHGAQGMARSPARRLSARWIGLS